MKADALAFEAPDVAQEILNFRRDNIAAEIKATADNCSSNYVSDTSMLARGGGQ
ncbi:hypothetical protein [Nocardia sp. NBC_01327]|uniref:hypothetical protein n=1 Tax=Nocardia sp. NBC_01327 TaxID=2903593 RepID=UPI002E0D4C9B|nr:hypothetical protein OG326_24225 [Nocardia sp. NBC_01327]